MKKPVTPDFDKFPSPDPNPEIFFRMVEEKAILEKVAKGILTEKERVVYASRHDLFEAGINSMLEIAESNRIALNEAYKRYNRAEKKIARHFKKQAKLFAFRVAANNTKSA